MLCCVVLCFGCPGWLVRTYLYHQIDAVGARNRAIIEVKDGTAETPCPVTLRHRSQHMYALEQHQGPFRPLNNSMAS